MPWPKSCSFVKSHNCCIERGRAFGKTKVEEGRLAWKSCHSAQRPNEDQLLATLDFVEVAGAGCPANGDPDSKDGDVDAMESAQQKTAGRRSLHR